jgi:KaiC/GvpD/RAD55 family RecA-like ATPase
MLVEVSVGEAIDKMTILLIKLERINDPDKKIEIQKEIDALSISEYQTKYSYYVRLLKYFNEIIWDSMDLLKTYQDDNELFVKTSKRVFDFNDRRFRIKSIINTEENSAIKEQKGYAHKHANINIDSLHNAIPIVNYILSQYCTISIDGVYKDTIRRIIPLKNIVESPGGEIQLKVSAITTTENLSIYNYEPIRYISGGQLGDFIHQLSIINENFMKTGRQGILYIYDIPCDVFRHGIDRVYSETFPFISKQPYILSYEKYSGQTFDIDLSSWRYQTKLFVSNWETIFGRVYGVEWGKNPWLSGIDADDTYKDTIILCHSPRRWDSRLNYPEIVENLKSKNLRIVFAQLGDTTEYRTFETRTGTPLERVQFDCILDFLRALAGCRVFVGNLSAPFCFAHAMHKKRIGILSNGPDDIHVEGIQINFTTSHHVNKVILDSI